MRSLKLLGAVVLMAAAANSAVAATITATFVNVGPGQNTNPASIGSTNAGIFNWNNASQAPVGSVVFAGVSVAGAGEFRAFCIETAQNIAGGNTVTYTVSALESSPIPGGGMGSEKATNLRKMWAQYAGSLTSNTDFAAFQVAIWKILGYTSGVVTGSNDATINAKVTTFTTEANWVSGEAFLLGLTSDTKQDQVIEVDEDTYREFEIPLPAGVALMLTGAVPMLGFMGLRRRRLA